MSGEPRWRAIPLLALAAFLLGPGTVAALRPQPVIPAPDAAFRAVVLVGEPDRAAIGAPRRPLDRRTGRTPVGAPLPPLLMAQEWALGVLGPREYGCLSSIVWSESRWDPTAVNPSNGRYGLGQFLGYRNPDPLAQLRHMLTYIEGRYADACRAWAHEQAVNWY